MESGSDSHDDLKQWETYCQLVSTDKRGVRHSSTVMGFAASGSEIARFAYRYRLASAFRGLSFNGYNSETVNGYEALFRLFLVYSAFERFMNAVGTNSNSVDRLLKSYGGEDCFARFKTADPANGLLSFLESKAKKPALKKALKDAIDGNPVSVERLAAAVRHIFAHGYLTPYDGGDLEIGGTASTVIAACSILSEFLMCVMDAEFSRIVSTYRLTL